MTQARTYPGADRNQWRGVDRPTMASVDKLLLHTTETIGWPSYDAGIFPTLTFNPWKPRGSRWRQHMNINQAATSLKNVGGYRTNRANVAQIEIVGYSDWKLADSRGHSSAKIGNISDDAYHELAEFYAWLHKEWGTELFLYPKWKPYPESYGKTNGVRMTVAQFGVFKGLCGHMHAPEQSHGDPGSLKVGLIVNTAKQLAGGDDDVATPEEIWNADIIDAPAPSTTDPTWRPASYLRRTHQAVTALTEKVDRQTQVLEAILAELKNKGESQP